MNGPQPAYRQPPACPTDSPQPAVRTTPRTAELNLVTVNVLRILLVLPGYRMELPQLPPVAKGSEDREFWTHGREIPCFYDPAFWKEQKWVEVRVVSLFCFVCL